jgi:hypothetical protein
VALMSNQDAFDFIERDFFTRSVIQLCRSWRFVSGDGLGVFNSASIVVVRRDSGGSKPVAAYISREPQYLRSSL